MTILAGILGYSMVGKRKYRAYLVNTEFAKKHFKQLKHEDGVMTHCLGIAMLVA